nr:hypothetical protein [Amycolatopsis taiwanensis]
MAQAGDDLAGEARLVDAMVPRHATSEYLPSIVEIYNFAESQTFQV